MASRVRVAAGARPNHDGDIAAESTAGLRLKRELFFEQCGGEPFRTNALSVDPAGRTAGSRQAALELL